MIFIQYSLFGLVIYGLFKAKTSIVNKMAADSAQYQQQFDEKNKALRTQLGLTPNYEGPRYRLSANAGKH
ncbi:MAG: hypothetical protein MHMPM18_001006 [Marteilia pararefringens]